MRTQIIKASDAGEDDNDRFNFYEFLKIKLTK